MARTTLPVSQMREFAPSDGGGINLDVAAGRVRDDNTITDKALQVVALTDDATNFVEIDNLGVATRNTSAFTAGSIPIAEVVAASGDITSVIDKRSWVSVGGGGAAGAPSDAQYVTLATDGDLSAERVLTAGSGIVITDAGAGSTVTVAQEDISARVFHATNQSIAVSTLTGIAFDSERFDTDTMHDTVTNNGRITFNTAGKYLVIANIAWGPALAPALPTGLRGATIRLNVGQNTIASFVSEATAAVSTNTESSITLYRDFAEDDFITLNGFHTDADGSINMLRVNDYATFLTVRRMD